MPDIFIHREVPKIGTEGEAQSLDAARKDIGQRLVIALALIVGFRGTLCGPKE
jgi:hypothetical protein